MRDFAAPLYIYRTKSVVFFFPIALLITALVPVESVEFPVALKTKKKKERIDSVVRRFCEKGSADIRTSKCFVLERMLAILLDVKKKGLNYSPSYKTTLLFIFYLL